MTGNVMIDTLLRELEAARAAQMPRRLGVAPKQYAFVTLHRPSNVDERETLAALAGVLLEIAARMAIVFPIHPRTRERLQRFGLDERLAAAPNVTLTEPLGYHESLGLIDSAAVALTDSGGIQEETSVLGVPCLTLRPNTERPVTIDLGTNTLIGGDLSKVVPLVDDVRAGRYKTGSPIPLWDGHAAERICDVLAAEWAKETN
jgi:UDP-N-acetylglucosamine 2-epimerase (non-hydrolysing)